MQQDRGRLLIVDDDRNMTAMLKKVLERNISCFADTAESGLQARNFMDKQGYDTVVTDIRMPDIDGIELLDIIKKKQ